MDQPAARPGGSIKTYRVRGIPSEYNSRDAVAQLLRETLEDDACGPTIQSLSSEPTSYHGKLVVTVTFAKPPEPVRSGGSSLTPRGSSLSIDTHFLGITPLNPVDNDKHMTTVYVVAIPGLGGHAFGSWRDRKGTVMWLRDDLYFYLLHLCSRANRKS